ncbi:MAG: hypothetical protein U9Q67_01675 [Patescibacteria group bacterium]|nr:hypothetical protein [Patescibacteria group bacterium]
MIKKVKTQKHKHSITNKQKDFFLSHVSRYCDKCGKPYSIDDIEILQQSDYSTIIHFSCKNCKARNIATFIRPLGVASRMPVNTDLSIDELGFFATKKRISFDEVLDVHETLKQRNVTVEDLFRRLKS